MHPVQLGGADISTGWHAYSGGTFDVCVRYGPRPELFQGFSGGKQQFPGSFWAVEGRVYGRKASSSNVSGCHNEAVELIRSILE